MKLDDLYAYWEDVENICIAHVLVMSGYRAPIFTANLWPGTFIRFHKGIRVDSERERIIIPIDAGLLACINYTGPRLSVNISRSRLMDTEGVIGREINREILKSIKTRQNDTDPIACQMLDWLISNMDALQ